MSVIKDGISITADERVSFGDYTAVEKVKAKRSIYGDEYSVKTHKDVTRLEKNGGLIIETVPGASVHDFSRDERKVVFSAEGFANTQFTLELLPETEYRLKLDGVVVGKMKTNVSGKLSFGAELSKNATDVTVEICG